MGFDYVVIGRGGRRGVYEWGFGVVQNHVFRLVLAQSGQEPSVFRGLIGKTSEINSIVGKGREAELTHVRP